MVKKSVCSAGDPGLILGRDDPLEKRMAIHPSILAWHNEAYRAQL